MGPAASRSPNDFFIETFSGFEHLKLIFVFETLKLMKTNTWIKLTFTVAVPLGLAWTVYADDAAPGMLPPAAAKQGVTYETDIKPILDNSCVKCHSGDKPKGHLKLDSLAGVLKGGKEGKVFIDGNSAKSPLVLRTAHLSKDDDDWMPPLHNRAGIGPLTPEQIGLIRAWIDQGAK
jgi:Planctomycete cytochrome C